MPDLTFRDRSTPWFVAALISACGLAAWWSQAVVFDDAYISYRYAENWVAGHGLVFNPGGDRVEGYTNFLWVVLSAAALLVGVEPFEATRAVGVASYALGVGAIAFVAATRARALGPQGLWLLPALACLVAPPRFAGIAGSGLETSFVALGAVALGIGLLARDTSRSAALVATTVPILLVLSRLDALIFVAAAVLADLAREDAGERRAALRRAMLRSLPLALVLGAWTLFRSAYYDAWLPNSYYAKGADGWNLEAGVAYLAGYVRSTWQVLPLLGLAAFGVLASRLPAQRRLGLYALLSAGACTLYIAKVGGDFMQYRFAFAPYLLIALGGLAGLVELARRQLAAAAFLGLAIGAWSLTPVVLEPRFGMQSLGDMNAYALDGLEIGPKLSAVLPAGTRVSTTLAGTIAYRSKLEIVDQWGLNERGVREWPSLPTLQRGHVKPAPEAWLRARGVELEIHHPTVCDCEALCTSPVPMLFVKLDERRCVRGFLFAPRAELIARVCSEPEHFILHGVSCSRDR